MIRPARLRGAAERLDEPVHDPAVLERDMRTLAGVNRWLGGRRALLLEVLPRLGGSGPFTLLDVGCGYGDVARALAGEAKRRGLRLRVVGLDRHAQILDLARRATPAGLDITFVRGNALALPFADRCFDAAAMSLALHHFEDGARARALAELARVARRAVIINELERSWPNYLGARLLAATLWRDDPLARHDGPVSVLRAFSPEELEHELRAAGLSDVRVRRRFFYRLVGSGAPAAGEAATAPG